MEGISAVIPNYNGIDLLPHTLPTVFEALHNQPMPFEVIVSDDASADDSTLFIEKNFPEIRIIRQAKNSGFSRTANLGISSAKYDWVLLLNSDVKLAGSYFLPLLPYMSSENCFGVMGRITNWETGITEDGAKYPRMQGMKIKTSGNYLLESMAKAEGLPSIYLSGANMFIRKSVFDEIGRLNEIFSPFYIEDFELCLRAWRLGYRCFYEHKAICSHKTSWSIKKNRAKKFVRKIYNRNKMFLHAIHLSGFSLFLWYLQVTLECIGRTSVGQLYFAHGYHEFLKYAREIRRSKKKLFEVAKGRNLKSVREVIREIRNFTNDKKIIRF